MNDLLQVETGNMCGDLWRDAEGRAYFCDGSRITYEDCCGGASARLLRGLIEAHGLTVRATDGTEDEIRFNGGRPEATEARA